MKHNHSFLFLILFLSGCSATETPSLEILWQDSKARLFLKAEKYEDSLQMYYGIVESNPYFSGTHSNIGVILNYTQKPEEALKSLNHALQLARSQKDKVSEFSVLFNLGVYYTSAKNTDEAIINYQAALEIVPTSIETKHNIELLVQQQQKQQGQNGEKSDPNQKNESGQGGSQTQQDEEKKDQKDQKDQGENQDKQNEKEGDQEKEQVPDQSQKRESSAKYKPRPFQGEQLSEGDVKKILGELRNQEQKIRANFEKKEKGKSKKNEKDW
jgi:Ca-activated chloride channel family protein